MTQDTHTDLLIKEQRRCGQPARRGSKTIYQIITPFSVLDGMCDVDQANEMRIAPHAARTFTRPSLLQSRMSE